MRAWFERRARGDLPGGVLKNHTTNKRDRESNSTLRACGPWGEVCGAEATVIHTLRCDKQEQKIHVKTTTVKHAPLWLAVKRCLAPLRGQGGRKIAIRQNTR